MQTKSRLVLKQFVDRRRLLDLAVDEVRVAANTTCLCVSQLFAYLFAKNNKLTRSAPVCTCCVSSPCHPRRWRLGGMSLIDFGNVAF